MYVKGFKVARRKSKRRKWKLPHETHNAIVNNLSYYLDFQIDTRMLKFFYLGMNYDDNVCKSVVLSKLHCVKSTNISHVNMEIHRMIGIPT